jgi:hypothetical protein
MRRTTLGGLTSSQLNARPSLAGSRLGALGEGGGKALPPPAPRAERSLGDLSAAPSLSGAAGAPIARGSLQRRTSVYSGSGSALRQVRRAPCALAAAVAALLGERSGQGADVHRAGRTRRAHAAAPRFVAGCTHVLRLPRARDCSGDAHAAARIARLAARRTRGP